MIFLVTENRRRGNLGEDFAVDYLEKEGYTNFIVTEVTMVPSNYITLDGETKERAINLIEELENIDDVQNIYHNLEL